MSYIRCLSNPEGLYIIGTYCNFGKGRSRPGIQAWIGHDFKLTNLNETECGSMIVPMAAFLGVVKRCDGGYTDVTHRGFSAKEVHVFEDDGSDLPADWDCLKDVRENLEGRPTRKTRYGIRLSYGDKWMVLWRTTWAYVVHNAESDVDDPKAWWREKQPRRKKSKKAKVKA